MITIIVMVSCSPDTTSCAYKVKQAKKEIAHKKKNKSNSSVYYVRVYKKK